MKKIPDTKDENGEVVTLQETTEQSSALNDGLYFCGSINGGDFIRPTSMIMHTEHDAISFRDTFKENEKYLGRELKAFKLVEI